MITTAALGVNVDPCDGKIVVLYKNEADDLVTVDITQVVQSMAEYVFMCRATSVRAPGPMNGVIQNARYVN